jgi:hypothetical protein
VLAYLPAPSWLKTLPAIAIRACLSLSRHVLCHSVCVVLQVAQEVVVLCCAIKPLCAWNIEVRLLTCGQHVS